VLVVESGGPGESHPRELWWDSNGWHHNDLTGDISTAPLSLVQAPCAFVFDADGTQHVDYVASDRQINEFWWQSGDWHHNNLGAAANARRRPRPARSGTPSSVSPPCTWTMSGWMATSTSSGGKPATGTTTT
jgi:hypothetical protein